MRRVTAAVLGARTPRAPWLALAGLALLGTCRKEPAPERSPVSQTDAARAARAAFGTCGDGKQSSIEACDDGNQDNRDGCTRACVRCDETIGDDRVALVDGSCVSRHNAPLHWLDAHKGCAALGGHLVAFTRADEQRTVETKLLRGDGARFWIGQRLYAADIRTTAGAATPQTGGPGNLAWVTGEPLTDECWHPEGRKAPPTERDCVTMSPASGPTPTGGTRYLWSLEDCDNERPSVCEVPPWQVAPDGASAYRTVYRLLSFDEAEAACVALGGHLAAITSAAELEFIERTFHRATWIGAHDREREGKFAWTANEPFDFEDFAPREPDNTNGLQHCVVMGADKVWHDRACFDRHVALCERR